MKHLLIVALLVVVPVTLLNLVVSYADKQASIDPNNVPSSYNAKLPTAQFHGNTVPTPGYTEINVLSSKPAENKDKRIEIDLTNQKLYVFEGNKKIYSFLVSTGKWGLTPTGEFHIWIKLKYTLMTGGSKALGTYYYLPNVPYTMYFYGGGVTKAQGYGIHGTYWHPNFGHPMSHGCINMKTEEAGTLFEWATSEREDGTGTKVVIYGITPQN